MIVINPSLSIDEREIEERFVRSSGPGGQNVNKVATAVQLRLDVNASSLPDDIKQRLTGLAGSRMTDDGILVIDARERLIALIQRAAHQPKRRRATKPGQAAKEKRLATKKRRGEVKATRQKTTADE